MRLKNNNNKNQGFTLIEMLVSIALFSVVLTVTLGSIMTIADSNKKARSLMSVTNNLNFAIDTMVRSFKSGDIKEISGPIVLDSPPCFQTFETDYASGGDNFSKRWVEYCLSENSVTGKGVITKEIGDDDGRTTSGIATELTSPDVDVEKLEFQISGVSKQPLLTIIVSGTVKVSEKISSNFSIQTSVSQRKLNI